MTNNIEEVELKTRLKHYSGANTEVEYYGMFWSNMFKGRSGRDMKQIAADLSRMTADLQWEITDNNNNVQLIFNVLADFGEIIELIERDTMLLNAIRF